MPNKKVVPPDPHAIEAFQEVNSRIRPFAMAEHLWNRVFTRRDRAHLGDDVDAAFKQYGTAGMWQKLRGVSLQRAIVDVGHKLDVLSDKDHRWLLREMGEVHGDPETAISEAVNTGDLVLTASPRKAYWQTKPVQIDWECRAALWNFFWTLCDRAKGGEAVDSTHLGERTHPEHATKQKSRLIGERGFPRSLGRLMRPAGRGAVKLDLPPEKIRLFELVTYEFLRERTA